MGNFDEMILLDVVLCELTQFYLQLCAKGMVQGRVNN